MTVDTVTCSNCGGQNRAGAKFCTHCGATLSALPPPVPAAAPPAPSPAPVRAVASPSPAPAPAPVRAVVGHVEGQAVIIGDNARQQISYYGDIIVRVDSLEELPPKPGEPPYKGLAYYTEADETIFFGREQLSNDLAARLQTTPFLAVAGASGSGKSSLLRAGVIPRLRRRNWLIHILTPTADPLSQLAAALSRDDADLAAADSLRARLAADPQTLRRKADQLVTRAGAERLLLIVDQFEELFTQCHDDIGRQWFIDNLLAAARSKGQVTILIGLRADFMGRLTEVEELRASVEQNFALLGPMQPEDVVRVIAEPARIGGWAFVNGLVEQFLSDVGGEPGRLPLLSHALLETWARRSGHVMTLKGYRAAGGVEGAIAKTAEDTLRRLDEQGEKAIVQAIFLSLTELGEGAEDTRRIVQRDELTRAGDPAAVDGVLNMLASARLVTVDEKGVQVAHEALIRRWPRLREWLADNRERLRFERQLEADALEWEHLNRDPGAFYRGARLVKAQEWTAAGHRLSPRVEEFLGASIAEVEREAAEREGEAKERIRQQEALRHEQQSAGRFKRLSRWLTAAAVIAVLATIIATGSAVVARNAQAEVERLNRETRSRRLAAEAENMLSQNQEAALLLAAAAHQTSDLSDGATTGEAYSALYHALNTAYRTTLAGHEGEVLYAAFNADRTRVVTAGVDGTARVWDAAGGEELAVLTGHQDWVRTAAFSPNGTRVVTASDDMTARVWDAASGAELAVLAGHENWLRWAAFSDDGTRVVTASDDGTARVWDAAGGEALAVLAGHEGQVLSAVFNADGTQVVTAGQDGTARVWDVASGEELALFSGTPSRVSSAAFMGDGSRVVMGTVDGTAHVWDVAGGEELAMLGGNAGIVVGTTLSGDEARLITAGFDGKASIWDAASGEKLVVLTGHKGKVNAANLSADGQALVTAGEDGTARLWDVASGEALVVLAGHENTVLSVAFSADGGRVVTASYDRTARIFDAASGAELSVLVGHEESINTAAFDADGTRVVTASDDATARIWDAATGEERVVLAGHESLVRAAAFSPDGTRVVTAGQDGTARVWDAASGAELLTLVGHVNGIVDAMFSVDGTRIVTGGEDRTARVWNAVSGEELVVLTGHENGVLSAAFNPDGTRVVTAGQDGTARVWDAAGGEALAVLAGHDDWVNSAAFSPDGTRVVTASDDGTAQVWDAAGGEALIVLGGNAGWVRSAAFSPDGNSVVTAGQDATARIWWVAPLDVLAEAQLRLRRDPTAIIPDFCEQYFQDAPDECPATLAELFSGG